MLTYNFTNIGSDSLYEYLYKCIKNEQTGEQYGWGKVLDYIGVGWEDVPAVQIEMDLKNM